MAATGLQMFWSLVTMTIATVTTTMTKVKNVTVDYGTVITGFAGDGDRYNTTLVNSFNNPKMTLTSGNLGQLLGLVGAAGAFAATHKDAKGATGGDIIYALSNAVCGNVTTGGAHAEYGEGSLEVWSFSTDGITSPLAYTRA